MITISSQRYINDAIAEAKRAASDYGVSVSPAFLYDGQIFRVVLDGHHSLEAARRDGVAPDYTEMTATDNDRVGLIDSGALEDFFEATRIDSDWYDIATGNDIW